MLNMLQNLHWIKGLDPVADAFSGTVYSDIIDMSEFQEICFVIYKGVGTTGTSTITVEASDDISGSNVSAVAFWYRAITSGDTHGALAAATTSGFTTTAGSSQLYAISIRSKDIVASGYKYCRLKAVEVVDSPVLGGILAVMGQPTYAGTHNSQID